MCQKTARHSQVRLGQVRLGQVRLGQARLGQARLGQVRLGQVRLGQVRLGQVRLDQIRLDLVLVQLHITIKHLSISKYNRNSLTRIPYRDLKKYRLSYANHECGSVFIEISGKFFRFCSVRCLTNCLTFFVQLFSFHFCPSHYLWWQIHNLQEL